MGLLARDDAHLFGEANADGTLRAVVHSAGVSPQMGDAGKMIAINALGTIHVTEAALALAGEGFAVVNVASSAAHMAPRALISHRTYRLAFTDPTRLATRLTARANLLPRNLRSGLAYTPITGLDLEPHAVTQRHDPLRPTRVALLRNRLPGDHDRVIDLIERRSQVGQFDIKVSQAALSGPHTGRDPRHEHEDRREDRQTPEHACRSLRTTSEGHRDRRAHQHSGQS